MYKEVKATGTEMMIKKYDRHSNGVINSIVVNEWRKTNWRQLQLHNLNNLGPGDNIINSQYKDKMILGEKSEIKIEQIYQYNKKKIKKVIQQLVLTANLPHAKDCISSLYISLNYGQDTVRM